MTHIFQRELNQYITELSRMIPNSYPQKKTILKDIKKNICDFLEDHPYAVWQDVITEFGSPSEISGTVLTEYVDTSFSTKQRKTHVHFIIFAICLTIIITITAYEYYWVHYKMYRQNPTHYISDDTEVSSEEFSDLTYIK